MPEFNTNETTDGVNSCPEIDPGSVDESMFIGRPFITEEIPCTLENKPEIPHWKATLFDRIISAIGLFLMILGLIMACLQQEDFWH